jgi:hypothetical protein
VSKASKEIKARIDALTDEQLERKVDNLRSTIPDLQEELDYASRALRDRRKAALQRKINDAR